MDQAKLVRAVLAMRSDYRLRHGFISEAECETLLAWAREMAPHLNANGEARAFDQVTNLPPPPPLYTEVRLRLQHWLGLSADAQPEAKFGWYLSIIGAGGFVQSHVDSTPEGTRHLRCNLFLQLPDSGGRPIIEIVPIDVAQGDLLAFYPSERPHSSEPVIGERKRILLSFGYTVPASHRLPPVEP